MSPSGSLLMCTACLQCVPFEEILALRMWNGQEYTQHRTSEWNKTRICVCIVCMYRWFDGCLLITKRPKAPSHYRYLIWVLCYIPYVGLNGVQFCDCLKQLLLWIVENTNFKNSKSQYTQEHEVWRIVMNKHPIKCLCIYNPQIIYIYHIQKVFFWFLVCMLCRSKFLIIPNSQGPEALN